MYTSKQVANYFIDVAIKVSQPVTPMKLQKLVYFAYGWYLALKEQPLLDEKIEAWQFGPVIPDLYHAVKRYGNTNITELLSEFDLDSFDDVFPIIPISDSQTRSFLESIWHVYSKYTAVQLSNATHVEGSPWKETIDKNQPFRKHLDIDDGLIKDYFKGLIEKRKAKVQEVPPNANA